jgi:hypothetical protein
MKYIVIEVDDDSVEGVIEYDLQIFNVVGIFKAPTAFCDNTDGHRGKNGFTRGKKYGWWVCTTCKKPTKAWSENLNAVLGAAYNQVKSKDLE